MNFSFEHPLLPEPSHIIIYILNDKKYLRLNQNIILFG
jgi:hypothetical protein